MASNRTAQPTDITRRTLLATGAGVAISGLGLGSAEAQASEIIDVHAHIISTDAKRYPPSPFGGGAPSGWAVERPQTFEQLIEQMNQAGVAKAAIVSASTYYGTNASYVADSIVKNPKRFTGVCYIDTLAPDNVKTLQGWVKRGITGLRIFTGREHMETLVDPKAFPVWEYAQTINLPIVLEATPDGWSDVEFLVKRYPKVRVLLDHGGQPKLEEGAPFTKAQPLFELAKYSNLYLKITPPLFGWTRKGKSTPDAYFPKLVAAYGANHLVFGSNLPATAGPMTKIIADAKLCLRTLSAKDRAMVMGGTAKTVYPALA